MKPLSKAERRAMDDYNWIIAKLKVLRALDGKDVDDQTRLLLDYVEQAQGKFRRLLDAEAMP